MSLAERLKEARNKAGYSQKELAEKLGMNLRTYGSYERGERDISTAVLLNICKALDISSDYLLGRGLEETTQDVEKYTPGAMIPIPVVGSVAAGYTCLAETDIIGYELVDKELILDGYEYMWLRVRGDSMEPMILEGDLVLVRLQPSVDSGDYGVVIVDEEDGLVKRIELDKNTITLISFNPYYPPREFKNGDTTRVRIVGKVIESKRKF